MITVKSYLIKLSLILLSFNSLCSLNSFSQQRLEALKLRLIYADSVIIVSHEETAGIAIVDERTGKYLPLPKLIVNGSPNQKIIHERRTLDDTLIKKLAGLISRPFQDSVFERGMCFLPHHAIISFKNRKASYVDICFGCKRIATSKDINISENDFDNRKWTNLLRFSYK